MKAKYLWLDLETTGLDPKTNCILECAALVTDAKLNQISNSVERVLKFNENNRICGEPIDAFVEIMHTKNGLWDECKIAATTAYQLDFVLRYYIGQFEWESKPILAGATIHFDRGFLKQYCPYFERELNHRYLDVSSLKLMLVDVFEEPFAKANAHRAMADVLESLGQAREIYRRIKADRAAADAPEWQLDEYHQRHRDD